MALLRRRQGISTLCAMRRHCLWALLACVALLGGAAAPAAAQDGSKALAQMVKQLRDKGRIDACSFSAAELKAARRAITPDIEQYAPDIGTAIDSAVQTRARGGCRKKGSKDTGDAPVGAGGGSTGSTGTTQPQTAPDAPTATAPAAGVTPTEPGPTTTPQPAPDPQPAPAAADQAIPEAVDAAPASSTTASDAPAPLILLLVLGALLLVAAATAAAVRWLAWEPVWLGRARHATAEAGWRTSAAWAEFTDWVRLGR